MNKYLIVMLFLYSTYHKMCKSIYLDFFPIWKCS